MGYLYLNGNMDRLIELVGKGLNLGENMNHKEYLIAGRNAVIEALRAKKPIDKIFVLDGCRDGRFGQLSGRQKKTDAILNL